jgi:WD40 repeat protein
MNLKLAGIFLTLIMVGLSPTLSLAQGYKPNVEYVDWSADGSLLAVGYDDHNTLEIIDPNTRQTLGHYSAHGLAIIDIEWSPQPDSNLLAVSYGWGRIEIIDADSGESILQINPGQLVDKLAWSPDGTRLAVGISKDSARGESSRSIVKIWDAATGELLRSLDSYEFMYDVDAIAWNPDGNRLAIGDYSGVSILDIAAARRIAFIKLEWVYDVAWSPDGSRLAMGSGVWDGNTYENFDSHLFGHEVDWSPVGRYIAALNHMDELCVVDAETLKTVAFLDPQESLHHEFLGGLSWSPDGQRIAFGEGPTLQIVALVDLMAES